MSKTVITTKRARVFIEEYGTGVLRDIGVVDEASYSFSEETIKKKSTNEFKGTIASQTITTDGTASLVMGDTNLDNFKVATRASSATVAAVTAGTFTYPVREAGLGFKLPSANITSMSVPGKTAGVDYQLFRKGGIVTMLTDNTTAIEDCTYSSGQTLQAGLTAAGDMYFTLHITNELDGELTVLYKARALLPDNISLISVDQFGTLPVKLELLNDDTKPSDSVLGQLGYKEEAQ